MNQNIEDILQDMNTRIDSIDTELRKLIEEKPWDKNENILIHDILIPVIFAILGGYVSVYFSKRTEYSKRQDELNYDIFQKCKKEYKQIVTAFNLLKKDIEKVQGSHYTSAEKKKNNNICYNTYIEKNVLNIVTLIEQINENINNIISYFEAENEDLKNYIHELFKEVKDNIHEIYIEIEDIGRIYKYIKLYNKNGIILEKDISRDICIEKYNNTIDYITKLDKKILNIYIKINKAHENVEDRLTGIHIEKRIIKSIKNPISKLCSIWK